MEPRSEDAEPTTSEEIAGELESKDQPEETKQIYLRTIYPLNPGIPHFLDVPGGW